MNLKKGLFLFLIFFAITGMSGASSVVSATNNGVIPTWVRVGAYASYWGQAMGVVIKYQDKYYDFMQMGSGSVNLTWKIISVSGDVATIDMKIVENELISYSESLPSDVKKLFREGDNGTYVYHDEHVFKVDVIKREIISNGGRVNLWIIPSIDVTWDKTHVKSVQLNPNATPVAKYVGTKYVPKVMVFPTDIKDSKNNLYDPYKMTAGVGETDAKIMEEESNNMTLPDPQNSSPYLGVWAYYLRDTGLLYSGNLVDDTLFSIFHNYGAMMVKLNHTNIRASSSPQTQSISIDMWGMITAITIGAVGVAAWILLKRKK